MCIGIASWQMRNDPASEASCPIPGVRPTRPTTRTLAPTSLTRAIVPGLHANWSSAPTQLGTQGIAHAVGQEVDPGPHGPRRRSPSLLTRVGNSPRRGRFARRLLPGSQSEPFRARPAARVMVCPRSFRWRRHRRRGRAARSAACYGPSGPPAKRRSHNPDGKTTA